jgi:SAM-dependent methyltransferase
MSFAIRNWLPDALKAPLWGNRKQWGLEVNADDPCWREWQKTYANFYVENQRAGIGRKINDAGYQAMSAIDLTGKRVLEIGAGDIRHLRYLRGKPSEYVLADISPDMNALAQQKLNEQAIVHRSILVQRNQPLPLAHESIDVIVSFYSLEHLYPLRPYLEDMRRVLKPGGILIGAIPAEGGMVWGGGRTLTSRRWFKRKTQINPDKIICWEHPNFADHIIRELDKLFQRKSLFYWPLPLLPLLDINLIIRFHYQKAG